MKTLTDRLVGLFAIFFTAALPLFAGMSLRACHPVLLETVGLAKGAAAPEFTLFVFDNFHALLWALFAAAIVLLALSAVVFFLQKDVVLRLGQLLAISIFSATLSTVFLAMFLFATTRAFQAQMMTL